MQLYLKMLQVAIASCHEASIHEAGCHVSLEDLDPSDSQLYLNMGEVVTLLPNIAAGIVSTTITKAQYTFYRLQRISDVADNLVSSYWATTDSEKQEFMQRAQFFSELPILVPHIYTLAVQNQTFIVKTTM